MLNRIKTLAIVGIASVLVQSCGTTTPIHKTPLNLSSTIQEPTLKPMAYIEDDRCFLLKRSKQPVVCQTIENAQNTVENINTLRQLFNEAVAKLKIAEEQYNSK